MADFMEVWRQAKRLCDMAKCGEDCPLHVDVTTCRLDYVLDSDTPEYEVRKFENIVMQWAVEHPESKYPTWREWQEAIFPDCDVLIEPCQYMSKERAGCCGQVCSDCRVQPIPADIAERLGVKPIEGGK